jgi:small subunit ribosomal protein S8e
MITHGRAHRKPTGGLLNRNRKKMKRDIGRDFLHVKIGVPKKKIIKAYGGNQKIVAMSVETANVTDPHTNTVKKSKIITVKENPANPHYVRMNIITKGAVIETDAGLARVTSRPGQHGVINAVLIKK